MTLTRSWIDDRSALGAGALRGASGAGDVSTSPVTAANAGPGGAAGAGATAGVSGSGGTSFSRARVVRRLGGLGRVQVVRKWRPIGFGGGDRIDAGWEGRDHCKMCIVIRRVVRGPQRGRAIGSRARVS